MAKLITETTNEIQILHEEVEGKKNLFITGPFLQSEVVNRNGRLYHLSILEREVARYTKEKIERNSAGGELNHPPTATLNLDRIALIVKSLTKEGNDFIGKAKITSTPMGDMARSLLDEGFNLGVSSRGIGSLSDHKNGYKLVESDFRLMVAADLVSDPSAPSAYVKGILEGVEFQWSDNNEWAEEPLVSAKKTLTKLSKENREIYGLKLIENHFLTFLKRNERN